MSSTPSPAEILTDLHDRRALREPVIRLRDYWRTYSQLTLNVVVLFVFYRWDRNNTLIWLFAYLSLAGILLTAVKETRRVINRRFDLLITQLERKGSL